MCLPSKLPSTTQSLFHTASSLDLKEQVEQLQQRTLTPCLSSDCPFRQTHEKRVRQGRTQRLDLDTYQEAEQDTDEDVAQKQCVKHDYHDHSKDNDSVYLERPVVTKGGVSIPFPTKLHNMLDHIALHENELTHIVSWQPHGRCFRVKKIKDFTEKVLPRFFQQKKYPSFQRQLNLYGFNRLTAGPDKGSYYHELFLRSKKALCRAIQRKKIKGTGCRMASNPKQEPNFYIMDPMPPIVSDKGDTGAEASTSAEVVISPTKVMPKVEEDTKDDSVPEMPPLPGVVALPVTSSITAQKILKPSLETLLGAFSIPACDNSGNSIDLRDIVERKERNVDTPSDLRFIFGGMPFHSLSVDDAKAPNYGTTSSRRNSMTFPVSLSDDGSLGYPILEDVEDFERQLHNIADLGSNGDLNDLEMSDILDRIACDEL